jgi:DMSO/TMAO reductase YedYZ heme-binding membrane subunit
MKQFFKSLFDDSNNINEKAVIGFAAFMMMVIFAVADIVTGSLGKDLVVNEFIYDSFKILTIACFGIASVDKWINKKGE